MCRGQLPPWVGRIRDGRKRRRRAGPADSQTQQSLNSMEQFTGSSWGDETAALQLFVHLEVEALNVTLLMPEGEYATWEGQSQGLSIYYSPGRLAVFRRRFDSVSRREGEDPSASATELEILAVPGFGDIGPQARTRMVRNRFISEQQSCRQRRHLDSLPPDTSIREIVDRCRVWESHSKLGREPPNVHRYQMEVASDSPESSVFFNG